MDSILGKLTICCCILFAVTMKFLGLAIASLGLVSAATVERKVSYDEWQVFRVHGDSNTAKFNDVVSKLKLEVWKGKPASGGIVDVMVPPTQVADFKSSTKDMQTQLMHANLGSAIATESSGSSERNDGFSAAAGNFYPTITYHKGRPLIARSAGAAPSATWFNSYHSIADHMTFISDLAAAYPNNAEVISAGKSLQNRDIKGIHIWGSGGKGSKKAVVFHSTVHAREWITTMVCFLP